MTPATNCFWNTRKIIIIGRTAQTVASMMIFLVFQKQFVAGVMGGAVKE